MRDGNDNEVFIRFTTELGKVTELKDKITVLKTEVKALDYDFRQGKISSNQLKVGLSAVTDTANGLNLSFKTTTDLGAQVYQVQQRASVGFKSLAVSVDGTTKSIDQMHNTLKQKTAPALISVSQIIQDAPYGIRGVGNNIEFLSQQFAQLSSQGMKTRDILSGMISNLSGPMGMLFAVSAVTAALQILGNVGFGSMSKVADTIKNNIKLMHDLGRISDDQYIKTLEREQAQLSKKIGASQNAGLMGGLWNTASAYAGLAMGNSVSQFIANRSMVGLGNVDQEAIGRALEIENTIKGIRDKEAKDYEKANKPEKAEKEKKVKDDSLKIEKELIESAKLRYELGDVTLAQYLAFLDAQIRSESSELRQLQLRKEYNDEVKKHFSGGSYGSVPTGLLMSPGGRYTNASKPETLAPATQIAIKNATKSVEAGIRDSGRSGFNEFEAVGTRAIRNVSHLLDDQLGGVMERTFGRATNAWQQFYQGMLTDLGSSFLEAGIGELLGAVIPGGKFLNMVLKGFGVTSSMSSMPASGQSAIASASQSRNAGTASMASEIRQLNYAMTNGQWKASGRDLVYVVDKSKAAMQASYI